ncbi:MAG: hypothetical protein K6A41_00470 [Bacteroidales bacterium]|nr:hypothetical protein [Bacteroidales bacterium]
MSDERFRNRYRIPSARAEWHDYDEGVYFITICTEGREHFFGEIMNHEMHLSQIGEYADECLKNVPIHNPYATIPTYVIMPDHIHLIVIIDGTRPTVTVETDGTVTVETVHAPSLQPQPSPSQPQSQSPTQSQQHRWKNKIVDAKMQKISQQKNKLSFAIGSFKSAVTKYAHAKQIPFAWQTRFYDHIICDNDELERCIIYIENNVSNWDITDA